MKQLFSHRFLNNFSITQKMMLIFVGCVIVPFLIQNIFFLNATEKNIQEEMMQRLQLSLSEKKSKVNGCISGSMSLALRYNTNEMLYNFLDTNYEEKINYLMDYQDNIKSLLLSDLAYNQQVIQLTLYSDNPTLFNGALVKKIASDEFDTLGENLLDGRTDELTKSTNGPRLRVALVPLQLATEHDKSLSIIRPLVYFPQYSKYKKALRIDINLSYISTMLRESDLFDNIVLVDSDNRIIASANYYHELGAFEVFSEDTLKKGIVVLKQPLGDVPLSLYGFYDSNIISKEFNFMRGKTILIAFGSMLLAFFFILMVAGNITKRTKLVVNLSKNIAKGNFTQISQDKIGCDEIGVLADSINHMSLQLQNLIDEEYNSRIIKAQLERENAQAKLLALQSQVDPHFMFNALESIRLKAIVKNEAETAKIIMYLSKMFRHLINWDDDIISLSGDMKFLEEFLFIQKYRFDDEFEYEIMVEEAAKACLLPKLIIQPVVENACVHGVESVSRNRTVKISVAVIDNQLMISVSDNGIGIDESRLAELKLMLQGGKKLTHSVGLYNVYQRLSLYYGRNFTMDIHSREKCGTEIDIIIPVRYSKEEF
ncbi:sensor histidine kinase [Ruminiclostridium cellobioparum]|uniref:sensor histidine kinase n=1 Tax=Ruminiclostridium cellobioparum TaxID=29355 RepID=UPI0028A60C54|nr:histidine kinase [Ruminiclostridium cellobioparum]